MTVSAVFDDFAMRCGFGYVVVVLSCLLASTARGQPYNAAAYTFTTLAGQAPNGSADGAGSAAQFNAPWGAALGTNGNIYVADSGNSTIRQVTPDGVVTTIAGFPNTVGNADGLGSAARFDDPTAMTADSAGNLFILDFVADAGTRTVRQMRPAGTNWVVSTIPGFTGPTALAEDGNGNLYVAGYSGLAGRVRDVFTNFTTIYKATTSGTNWLITSIYSEVSLTTNQLADPFGAIAADQARDLFLYRSNVVEQLQLNGTNWVMKILAGALGQSGDADGTNGAARFGRFSFRPPSAIVVDGNTDLYVADGRIRQISPEGTNWVVTTLAGGLLSGSADGTGTNAGFEFPDGMALNSAIGALYVADTGNNTIRKVTTLGVVTTLAGRAVSAGTVDGLGSAAEFTTPTFIARDGTGNLYISDTGNGLVREVTPFGQVSTIAGGPDYSGGPVDGVGGNAQFAYLEGIAVDSMGNIFVADGNAALSGLSTIREINPQGRVTTIAGHENASSTFADGVGTNAVFNGTMGLAIDADGNIYAADSVNCAIRKLVLVGTNWVVTTIAGSPGNPGSADGVGTNATFSFPTGLAFDSAGNLFVTDSGNDSIREISPVGTNWVVSTIAGMVTNNMDGPPMDVDGTGTNAVFGLPYGITVDGQGNIYVTESYGDTIREITHSGGNWVVTTIAGSPTSNTTGLVGGGAYADGVGDVVRFAAPEGIVADRTGNLYVVDNGNNVIRVGTFTPYTSAYPVPYVAPAPDGELAVTLLPPEAGGQWRLPWEITWHNSGDVVTNLVPGEYAVEFRSVPGYLAIPPNLTSVEVNAGANDLTTNVYYPTIAAGDTNSTAGSLTVYLNPIPNPPGAGWRFLGDTTPYFPSGYTTNLLAGTYLLEFAPVAGRSTPQKESVPVYAGQPTIITATYSPAAAKPAGDLFPFPVLPAEIGDLTNNPFGFNGQLQSDTGFGSGVAVQTNVVLTAAHLVFNDQTLSYVSRVYWYFQGEAGVSEPEPVAARGWYVLSGYAAQRTNDLQSGLYGADQSSPQSRNQDVAALYFVQPMANGGYGGYLASDATPNSWLAGTSLKMLVGYPVDGSVFGDTNLVAGAMYQTDPQPYPLSPASDPVADQQVYVAPWLLSYPGNSGGPLYVQYNGYYYPAGVYLGTLFNGIVPYASAVRGIDSNVVNLINLAQTLGDNGTNNTGGGVITIIPDAAISSVHPGYIQWRLGPPAAVLAGAGWRLAGDAAYSGATNYTRAVLDTNNLVVQFKPIPGWNLPASGAITITPDHITSYSAFYTVANPVLSVDPALGIALTGTTGTTYRLEACTSLTAANWQPVTTNTILSTGAHFILPSPAANQPATFYRAVWLQ